MSSSTSPAPERVLPPEPPTWASGEGDDRAIYGADPSAPKPPNVGPDFSPLLQRLGGGPVPSPIPYTVEQNPAARTPPTLRVAPPGPGYPRGEYPPALGPARTPDQVYAERHHRNGPPVPPVETSTVETSLNSESPLSPPAPPEPLHFQPLEPPPLPGHEYDPMPSGPVDDHKPLDGIVGLSATAILMAVVLPPVGVALGIHCLRELAAHRDDAPSVGSLPALQSRVAIAIGTMMSLLLLWFIFL